MKDLKKKLIYGLFFGFLLLVPSQLGRHFWFDWTSVLGIRIDYLAPTLYVTDILVIILLCLNNNFKINKKWLILIGLVIINVVVAKNKLEAGYKMIRLMELWGLFFYVKNNQETTKKILMKVIPYWIVGESLLGWWQVIKGSSVNGLIYFLGERMMTINTIGVAKWTIWGSEHLRAYGTFSHPNSLAGFLLVSIVLWCWYKARLSAKFFWWMVFWLGILGIIICGSRTVWLVGGFLAGIRIVKKNKWWLLMTPLVVMAAIYKNEWFSGWDPASWQKRWDLIVVAAKMIKDNIVWGVGGGNFLVRLPEYRNYSPILWLQPVHNIYLLLITELGMGGVVVLMWLAGFFRKEYLKKIFLFGPTIAILLTGLNDHYWITLIQNIWLMTIVFGLIR